MKYLLLILITLIFITGCTFQTQDIIPNENKETTTSTINKITTTLLEKTCNPNLIRKIIQSDGSYETKCLTPEELKLKECFTNQDCLTPSQECRNGYCFQLYEDDYN